jgi:hypothetical protein
MRNGGREKGTPNVVTTELRSLISTHLDEYLSNQFFEDWTSIPPRERVRTATALIKLVLPMPKPEVLEQVEDTRPDEIKITIVTAKDEIERLKELRPSE